MQPIEPLDNQTPVVEIETELADLLPQYLSNRWADLVAARELLHDGDFTGLAHIAHRIRGTAASYGFRQLGDIAGAIETAAETGDSESIEHRLADYDAFLRSVRIEYV
jgi:hypothetical protein